MRKQRKHIVVSGKRYDEVILTEEECNDYANRWKNFVGLSDWAVNVRVLLRDKMELKGTQGEVWADTHKQVIAINILDPKDYSSNSLGFSMPQNMEKTIIHELKHVSLYPLKVKRKLLLDEEVYIEKQSHAFYELTQGRHP